MSLVKFRTDNIHGALDSHGVEKIVMVEASFFSYMVAMDASAKRYGIVVKVNQAVRYEGVKVNGAIVKPASHSCHLVGHAIDCNLLYKKRLYNSLDLQIPNGEIRQFIDECKHNGLRWGGDFTPQDTVHFDSDLFHKNPVLWKNLHDEIQNAK